MPSSIYTRRLFSAVTGEPNTPSQVYRAAEGQTTIVRDLVVWNAGTAPFLIRVFVVTGSLGYSLWALELAAGVTEHLDLRQELYPDDIVYVQSDGPAGYGTVLCTGYIFV